jgi:hypothetical protein
VLTPSQIAFIRFSVSDAKIQRLDEKRTERLLLRRWGDVTMLASRLLDARTLPRDANRGDLGAAAPMNSRSLTANVNVG